MQFKLLLGQEAQIQWSNPNHSSSTVDSPENAPHSKVFRVIPTPFKHLHLPNCYCENKPRSLMGNETAPPPPLPPPTGPLPPPPISPQAPVSPTSMSPPRERSRRYSLDEVVADYYADTASRSKEDLLPRRQRSFDSEKPLINTNRQVSYLRPEHAQQEHRPKPVSNHSSSQWSNSTDPTRVIFTQDPPQSPLTPDSRNPPASPFAPTIITGYVGTPLGLSRFEKPKLELDTSGLAPESSGGWTPQKLQSPSAAKQQRDRSRKPSLREAPARDIKISAPASLDNATNFVDFKTWAPRTAPLPPPSGSSPSASLKNIATRLVAAAIVTEERQTSNHSPTTLPRITDEPVRKTPGFSTIAKVAGRLLRHQSQTRQTPSPVVKRTSLPPLLYSASTPIEQHVLAVSTRIKDESKMKPANELELPLVNAATEEEFIQQVRDINNDIARCAKEIARLLPRCVEKRKGKLVKAKKAQDFQCEVRTNLNRFLVTRVFRPFSIQLSEEDDEVLRNRYEEIAPSVSQFVASRWRVVASASTSRPIQELGPVLGNLVVDASIVILRDCLPDAELTKEMTALLVPLIRHAYLLAHFNHLEMITADYDIFYGTEIGGWVILSQEEEKHSICHSKAQDSRVSGYWSLGLRKKRYVGEGVSQRRVWDVLLKSKVLTSAVTSAV